MVRVEVAYLNGTLNFSTPLSWSWNMDHWNTVYTIFAIIDVFAIIFGLVLNGIVILVILASRSLHTNFHFAILSLAFADVCLILSNITNTLQHYIVKWIFPIWLCKLTSYFQWASFYIVIYTILTIVVYRFLMTSKNPTSSLLLNKRIGTFVILMWWMIMSIGNIGVVHLYDAVSFKVEGNETIHICLLGSTDTLIELDLLLIGAIVIGFVLPGVVMFVLTSITFLRLYVNRHYIAKPKEGVRFAIMSALIAVVFYICWLPLHTHWLRWLVDPEYIPTHEVDVGFALLAKLSSVLNPIIYNFLSPEFQLAARQRLFKESLGTQLLAENDEDNIINDEYNDEIEMNDTAIESEVNFQ